MLKRLALALSVIAAFGLAFAGAANAKDEKKKDVHVNKNVHVNKTVHVNRTVHVNGNAHVNGRFVVGRTYNGHIWYGHNRHYWRGRWYAYGVGPCWINVDGEWFWNVVACPI
ncbi:MAG TPA: hypothetical protein VFW22_02010 [Pseudolabrys sp.]|nr:hypothetical protein [Pseudolabrys sp.]